MQRPNSILDSIFCKKQSRNIIRSQGSFSSDEILENKNNINILNYSPDTIALHLSIIDLNLFKKITHDELYSCSWLSGKKYTLAPNIMNMMRQFNNICIFVIGNILKYKTAKERSIVLSYYIKLIKCLKSINNINSLKAIITALQSTSIYRLKESWELVNKKDKEKLKKYEEFLSENDNKIKLRSYLLSTKLPCIPYLGMYLTDITYIDTIYPMNKLPNERKLMMNNILKSIIKFQSSEYSDDSINKDLLQFLRIDRYLDECKKYIDDHFFEESIHLEPLHDKSSFSNKTHSRINCQSDNTSIILKDKLNSHYRHKVGISLLDGSPIVETTSNKNNNIIIRPKNINVSNEHNIIYEGKLKRQYIIKNCTSMHISSYKKLWVIYTTNHLLIHYTYNSNIFSCLSPPIKEPYQKVINLSQFIVSPNPHDKSSFVLISLDKKMLYRYTCKNPQQLDHWVSLLTSKSNHFIHADDNISLNLISFDTHISNENHTTNDNNRIISDENHITSDDSHITNDDSHTKYVDGDKDMDELNELFNKLS